LFDDRPTGSRSTIRERRHGVCRAEVAQLAVSRSISANGKNKRSFVLVLSSDREKITGGALKAS
jgi:hypothetical protein